MPVVCIRAQLVVGHSEQLQLPVVPVLLHMMTASPAGDVAEEAVGGLALELKTARNAVSVQSELGDHTHVPACTGRQHDGDTLDKKPNIPVGVRRPEGLHSGPANRLHSRSTRQVENREYSESVLHHH